MNPVAEAPQFAREFVEIGALGNLLTSGALLGIDACPVEGFDRAQDEEILGLKTSAKQPI